MKRTHKIIVAVVSVAAVATIGAITLNSSRVSPTPTNNTVVDNTTTPTTCKSVGALPDKNCTPGFPNPNITQANIKDNICNPSWSTKSIRPPVSYTNPLKIKQIALYGYSDTSTSSYEEDHLISLELGGSPTDPRNLWPEAYLPNPGAREKDKVENFLHKEVCNGAITLQEAQQEISNNWLEIYMNYISTQGK